MWKEVPEVLESSNNTSLIKEFSRTPGCIQNLVKEIDFN